MSTGSYYTVRTANLTTWSMCMVRYGITNAFHRSCSVFGNKHTSGEVSCVVLEVAFIGTMMAINSFYTISIKDKTHIIHFLLHGKNQRVAWVKRFFDCEC